MKNGEKNIDNRFLLSVLVLTYNQENTILQTLQSVINQKTNFYYELLIGDDHSFDSTKEKIELFITKNKCDKFSIKLFPATENVGVIKNFVKLINKSIGKYVAVIAGDDYWISETKLQKQINFLEKNPQYGLVHTNFNIFYETENKIERNLLKRDEGYIFENLLFANQIGALTTMFKRSLVLQAFDKKLYQPQFLMEDYPLWLSIALVSKIGYINEVTAVWRKSAESVSNSLSISKNIIFDNSVLMVQSYFAKLSQNYLIVLERLISIHRRHLMLAYIHNIKVVGDNSYNFLKENKALNFSDKKNYLGIKFVFAFKILKSVKNIKFFKK